MICPEIKTDVALESQPDSRACLRMFLLVFFFLNCLYLITSTGRVRVPDEALTLFQSQSFVLSRSFTIPQALETNRFYGRYDLNGKPRAPYPPLHALLASPWYAIGHFVLARIPGVPFENRDLIVTFAVTLSSATFAALSSALALAFFLRIGVTVKPGLVATLFIALATPLFAYSGWFFSEPLASVFLIGAVMALFGDSKTDNVLPSGWGLSLAGVLMGAALFVRPAHAIAIPPILMALLVQHRTKAIKPALRVGAVTAIAAAGYLLWNSRLYGSVLEFGYPTFAEGGRRLNSFETPIYLGLWGFLFSPGKSVFLFAPPTLLALCALPLMWRRPRWRGLACVATLTPATYLLFYSGYTQWEGGYCFGPRYLVAPILLLCLGLGPLLSAIAEGWTPRFRTTLVLIFTVGIIVQMIGLSTSFLEDQANGSYYDQQWNYRLDYSLAGQGRLLLKYLSNPAPAPLGKGLDRWFVFLAKAGVPAWMEIFVLLLAVAGMTLAARGIRRTLRTAESLSGDPGPVNSSRKTQAITKH
jgi:hypothetical protein